MESVMTQILVEGISKLASLTGSRVFVLADDVAGGGPRTFAGDESFCRAFVAGELTRDRTDVRIEYDAVGRRCAWVTPREGSRNAEPKDNGYRRLSSDRNHRERTPESSSRPSSRSSQRQRSPENKHRQKSPENKHQQKSPENKHQQKSPEKKHQEKSPENKHQEKSPENRHRQRSPENKHRQRSQENKHRQRSPEIKHRQSSPENKHRQSSPETPNRRRKVEDSHEKDENSRRRRNPESSHRQRSFEDFHHRQSGTEKSDDSRNKSIGRECTDRSQSHRSPKESRSDDSRKRSPELKGERTEKSQRDLVDGHELKRRNPIDELVDEARPKKSRLGTPKDERRVDERPRTSEGEKMHASVDLSTAPQVPDFAADEVQLAMQDENLMSNIANALKKLPGLPLTNSCGVPPAPAASGSHSSVAEPEDPHPTSSTHRPPTSSNPEAIHPEFPPPPPDPINTISDAPPPTVTPWDASATRTVVTKANDADENAIRARFDPFGAIVSCTRSSTGDWRVEMDSVEAAVAAINALVGKDTDAVDFAPNHEFSDCIWIAFLTEGSPEGALEEAAASAATKQRVLTLFSRFGKIVNAVVRCDAKAKTAQALVYFRTPEHARMVIERVRGRSLGGQRFQIDVASKLFQIRFKLPPKPPSAPKEAPDASPKTVPSLMDLFSPSTSAVDEVPFPTRTIRLLLSENQMSVLRQCPKSRLVELFTNYGVVVDVSMPTSANSPFLVEYLDVASAQRAVEAGNASGGAFAAAFFSRVDPTETAVWIGGLDFSRYSSAVMHRLLSERLASVGRSSRIVLARSMGQALAHFATPEAARAALSVMRSGRIDDWRDLSFDISSAAARRLFSETMTQDDLRDNAQLHFS